MLWDDFFAHPDAPPTNQPSVFDRVDPSVAASLWSSGGPHASSSDCQGPLCRTASPTPATSFAAPPPQITPPLCVGHISHLGLYGVGSTRAPPSTSAPMIPPGAVPPTIIPPLTAPASVSCPSSTAPRHFSNRPVPVLFDNGCSFHAAISAEEVRRLRLPTLQYTEKLHVQGYDGDEANVQPVVSYVPSLLVEFESYSETLYQIPILPSMSSEFGIILGTGWFKQRDAHPDFKLRRVTFRDAHHRECAVFAGRTLDERASIGVVCSARAFRNLTRKAGCQSFVAFVHAQPPPKVATDPWTPYVTVEGTGKEGVPEEFTFTLPDTLDAASLARLRLSFKHHRLFAAPHSSEIPDDRVLHDVELLPGSRPPYQRPRPTSPVEATLLSEHIAAMVAQGIVRPSRSPFGAPVLFALKPDGSLRFCVDYRQLNEMTKKDRYPLPNVEQMVARMGRSRVFSTFDLHASFWQVRLSDPSSSAFVTAEGQFEFLVMPFGMCNAPSTMQRFMQDSFADMPFVTIYLDDIGVHSDSEAEHITHLAAVLDRLHLLGLRANPRKCSFFQSKVHYLGHVISYDSVEPDPEAVSAVTDYPAPTSVPELRRFLGLAGWLRKFVHRFASLTHPLNELLEKKRRWNWTHVHQTAFEQIRLAISSPPALLVADPNLPYVISYDSQEGGIGATLMQDHGSGLQPVAFRSRSLKASEESYAPWELEVRGLVDSVHDWHKYIDNGIPLECLGDHAGLTELMNLKEPTRMQSRWIMELMPYMPHLAYAKGKSAIMAPPDALSRAPHERPVPHRPHEEDIDPHIVAAAIRFNFSPPPTGFSPATTFLPATSAPAQAPTSTSTTPAPIPVMPPVALPLAPAPAIPSPPPQPPLNNAATPDFPLLQSLIQGYATPSFLSLAKSHKLVEYQSLWYTDAKRTVLAVPDAPAIRAHLISAFHDVPYAGHRGRDITVSLLSERYWWPSLAADVARYVRECPSCQATSNRNTLPPGLLQPEEIAADCFNTMSIDFIFHLPLSKTGHSGIMTVVDKASRACVLIPIHNEKLSASQAAILFRRHVFSRGWGIPLKLISDRDPRFVGRFWTELHRLLGCRLALSTSYHPQTDSTTEIVHRELNDLVRNSAGSLRKRWPEFVDLFEFAHNNHVNTSTGFSPFVVIHGRAPHTPSVLHEAALAAVPGASSDLLTFLRLKRLTLALAERNVVAAQARQKHYYDLRHSPTPTFAIGSYVFLNSEHYRITLAPKAEDRWLGPFKVLERLGELNYRLELPSHMNAHDVFHCSVLKAHVPPVGFTHPPPSLPVLRAPLAIEVILAHRRVRGGTYVYSEGRMDEGD